MTQQEKYLIQNQLKLMDRNPRPAYQMGSIIHLLLLFKKKLYLGNLNSKRDWGHAKDYVEAMWMMLQQNNPDDFVIGTGKEHSVMDFANKAFAHVGLNYKDYLIIDKNLIRPAEVDNLLADYTKAKKELKWEPKISFEDLVTSMVESDLEIVTNLKY